MVSPTCGLPVSRWAWCALGLAALGCAGEAAAPAPRAPDLHLTVLATDSVGGAALRTAGPIVLRLTKAGGVAVANADVTVTTPTPGAAVGDQPARVATVLRTDSAGVVRAAVWLAPAAGVTEVIASATGSDTARVRVRGVAVRALHLATDTVRIGSLGDTVPFAPMAELDDGRRLPAWPINWESSDTAVVVVDSTGRVTARANGVGVVRALVPGQLAYATVRVRQVAATLAPLPTDTVGIGGWLVPAVEARDGHARVIVAPALAWQSLTPGVATVDSTGRVVGIAPGTASLTVRADSVTRPWQVVARAGPGPQVSVGGTMACALSPVGQVACWGANEAYQLAGASASESCQVVTLNIVYPCATRPRASPTAERFVAVSAGFQFACALRADGQAFCWGSNTYGQIGTDTLATACAPVLQGPTTCATRPVPVDGAVRFSAIGTGQHHACGLATDGTAWCWGNGSQGAVGQGAYVSRVAAPTAVAGSVRFVQLAVGGYVSCGLDAAGAAWCWGQGSAGANGQAGYAAVNVPTPVATGVRFSTLAAGRWHTCGLAVDGRAWCWGESIHGESGSVAAFNAQIIFAPTAMDDGRAWRTLALGAAVSCGIAASGAGACWGDNSFGQVGAGTINTFDPRVQSPLPLSLAASLDQVDAGWASACAVRTGGLLFCWGHNDSGTLGVGPIAQSAVPLKVTLPW